MFFEQQLMFCIFVLYFHYSTISWLLTANYLVAFLTSVYRLIGMFCVTLSSWITPPPTHTLISYPIHCQETWISIEKAVLLNVYTDWLKWFNGGMESKQEKSILKKIFNSFLVLFYFYFSLLMEIKYLSPYTFLLTDALYIIHYQQLSLMMAWIQGLEKQ